MDWYRERKAELQAQKPDYTGPELTKYAMSIYKQLPSATGGKINGSDTNGGTAKSADAENINSDQTVSLIHSFAHTFRYTMVLYDEECLPFEFAGNAETPVRRLVSREQI